MKKTFGFVLMSAIFFSALAYATIENVEDKDVSSDVYSLDEEKVAAYEIKAKEENSEDAAEEKTPPTEQQPKIITEDIPNGRIEKLVDDSGRVIAEKTIERDKVIKKVLNYYYPTGQLMKQIIAQGDDGFYAEEYYTNGKISSQAAYINELSKIGKEKKYDTTGVLRQEIMWVLPETEKDKPAEMRITVRQGNVITYYPTGKRAAVFAVGNKGKSTFYNTQGEIIKEIKDSEILNFNPDLSEEDCRNKVIKLSLEELIELYEDEGDISYNKCGLPYRENFVYEVFDTKGTLTQRVSYDEKGMIRRITPYISGRKSGVEKKYDASGNLIAEIKYKKGVKDGKALGFFPVGALAFRKNYVDGKVDGILTCYFPTGEIAAEFTYKNGLKEGKGKVNSPVKRELEFKDGKLLNEETDTKPRQLTSMIANLSTPSPQCLDIKENLQVWLSKVNSKEREIKQSFQLKLPKRCEDVSVFRENNHKQLECFDEMGNLRASLSASYNLDEYVVEKVYDENKKLLYTIPYKDKQKQGWARQYDANSVVVSEIFFNHDEMAETARDYYPNGRVKNIYSIADNAPRKMFAQYQEDGDLLYSLTYKEDNKQEAYLNNQNEDIYIHYYEGKPDSINLNKKSTPYSTIIYNLALNEYAVYQNREIIEGGKICAAGEWNFVEKEDVAEEAVEEPQAITTGYVTETLPEKEISTEKQENIAIPNIEPLNPDEVPVVSPDDAPFIENLEPITAEDIATIEANAHKNFKIENAIIPTEEEKHQAELAAKNIGPLAKPDIEQLADVVQKETVAPEVKPATDSNEAKTEKFYYPNGSLRKTVKTQGPRTEEVKEYSKNGLLLTDTIYKRDRITIEKYFGSGEVRRKTEKSYDDNTVLAFLSREDYFDTGKPRYEVRRLPETLLFAEKNYYPDGKLRSETTQNSIFSSITKEYTADGDLSKETMIEGLNTIVKGYEHNNLKTYVMNNKDMPLNLEKNSTELLQDNTKLYEKGILVSAYKKETTHDDLAEYYKNGKVKTEIVFYHNGEISIKYYNTDGTLAKFAYLAPDGKLHIEKPVLKVIPSYRERHWVDYNNPKWVENQDKYSIRAITRLNLDTVAYILAELGIDVPEIMKKLYDQYE